MIKVMMITRFNLLFLILFMSLLLTSCAQLQPVVSSPALTATWDSNQNRLKAIQSWQISGSIRIVTEEKNWSARFYWEQEGPVYQLRFNAPLGQGAMLLEGDDSRVTMRTAKNEVFIARDPNALVAKTMQVEIPVTHLHYWVRGISAPKPTLLQYQLNELGYLYSLEQDGWKVQFVDYMEIGKVYVPKKLYLYNNRFEVTMVISRWHISSPANDNLSELHLTPTGSSNAIKLRDHQ